MSSRTKTITVTAATTLLVLLLAYFIVVPRLRPSTFFGQVIQSGSPAPTVELDGADGRKVALTDYDDQIVVLYFGYTFCPDVCSQTLAKLNRSMLQLGDKAEDVQVIMITVDPERDTAEKLGIYTGHFNESFIGLTGDPADIDHIAKAYDVYFEAEETTSAAEYLVNHTATVMVVDRNGELKLLLPFEATAEQIAADLAYLVG